MNKYPLEEVFFIKKRKLTEAERVLKEKKDLLAKEMEILAAVKKEYDEARALRDAKLKQLREALDAGAPSSKIEQMKGFFKMVDEKSKQKEQKLSDQKKQVTKAEKVVETARADYVKKQMDVEKLSLHKEEWAKGEAKEEERKEATHTDEIGTTGFSRRKKAKKKDNL